MDGEPTSGNRYELRHNPAVDAAIAPTCTETGLTEGSHCAVCSVVLVVQETVPALGHDWGAPSYQRNDAHTQVTATRSCKRDANHTKTETVSAASEITVPAACTTEGRTTYTSAAFVNPAFSVHSITLANIPMLEHIWTHRNSTAADSADGVRGGIACSMCGREKQADRPVSAQHILRIPAMAQQIEDEAFSGIAAQQVVIPSGTLSIGSRAFADCNGLLIAVIPRSVASIADDTFQGSDIAVICPDDSVAAAWCDEHHIPHNP